MDLETFLTLSPRQVSNSTRLRSQSSKDKAIATLKERWAQNDFREQQADMLRDYWSSHDAPMKGKYGALNKTSRPVVTPLGEFGSGLEAAKAHKVTSVTIRYRIQRLWPGYAYLDEPPAWILKRAKAPTKPRRRILEIVTPLGRFPSMGEASRMHGYKGVYTLFNRFKADPANYYRVYQDV
jgi:hypothetical protein